MFTFNFQGFAIVFHRGKSQLVGTSSAIKQLATPQLLEYLHVVGFAGIIIKLMCHQILTMSEYCPYNGPATIAFVRKSDRKKSKDVFMKSSRAHPARHQLHLVNLEDITMFLHPAEGTDMLKHQVSSSNSSVSERFPLKQSKTKKTSLPGIFSVCVSLCSLVTMNTPKTCNQFSSKEEKQQLSSAPKSESLNLTNREGKNQKMYTR